MAQTGPWLQRRGGSGWSEQDRSRGLHQTEHRGWSCGGGLVLSCRVESVAQLAVGQGSGEGADRLLLPAIRDGHEVARQLEHLALLRGGLDGPRCRGQPVVEIVDLDAKGPRDDTQAAGGNPVDALLVLVCLLVGDPDQLGQLLLGQAQQDAPLAQPRPDMPIDILQPAWRMPCYRSSILPRSWSCSPTFCGLWPTLVAAPSSRAGAQ